MSNDPQRIEPITMLLFGGLVFFAFLLIFVEWRFNSDAQVFQVIAGVLTGFAGAFFGRMKPDSGDKPQQPGSITTTATLTQTPPDPKP